MKNKKYTKTTISILATIILSYWLVSAWTNITSVASWDALTSTLWNEIVTKLNDTGQRASGIFTDGSWNVGIGTSSPVWKLDVIDGGWLYVKNSTWLSSVHISNYNTHPFIDFVDTAWAVKWNLYYNNDISSLIFNSYWTNTVINSAWWNVWVWTSTPTAKLDVNGSFIRTIAHASWNWPTDQIDSWQVVSRVLTFNKTKSTTTIRINYTDNFRVLWADNGCRWEIKVNWASCSQPLVYDFYTDWPNNHQSNNLLWYCSWISTTWNVQIWVYVGNVPWYSWSDCVTWWSSSTWVLDAEEVN